MEDIIKLHNRMGLNLMLKRVYLDWWTLSGNTSEDIKKSREYASVTYNGNDSIYSYDPPGGPFLCIASEEYCNRLIISEIRLTSFGLFIKMKQKTS